MPYTASFYLYLFVAGVVVVVLASLLSPLGLLVNLVFAVAAAYLAIVIWSASARSFGESGTREKHVPSSSPPSGNSVYTSINVSALRRGHQLDIQSKISTIRGLILMFALLLAMASGLRIDLKCRKEG
jgi:hypothetical protein